MILYLKNDDDTDEIAYEIKFSVYDFYDKMYYPETILYDFKLDENLLLYKVSHGTVLSPGGSYRNKTFDKFIHFKIYCDKTNRIAQEFNEQFAMLTKDQQLELNYNLNRCNIHFFENNLYFKNKSYEPIYYNKLYDDKLYLTITFEFPDVPVGEKTKLNSVYLDYLYNEFIRLLKSVCSLHSIEL